MSYKRPKQYASRSGAAKLSRRQLYGIAAIAVIIVSLIGVYAFFTEANGAGLKAAIVDQLSPGHYENGIFANTANATFVKTATATLTAAGYTVTYYNGSEVNVNFYRTLPLQGYALIIFRVHTALAYNKTSGQLVSPLDLFTAEPYVQTNYVYEQSRGYLDVAMYQPNAPRNETYFGIKDLFISSVMQGRFDNTTIIMMGCNGLDYWGRSWSTRNALLNKGARVIIGWNDAVGVDHTDVATKRLLGHLLIEDQILRDAVNTTKAEVGSDPFYKGALTYYSFDNSTVGSYLVPHSTPKTASLTDAFFMLGSMIFVALPQALDVNEFPVSKELRMKIF